MSLTVGFVAFSFLIWGALVALGQGHFSWPTGEHVCVRVTNGALFGTGQTFTPDRPLSARVEVHAPITEACVNDPTTAERAWFVIGSTAVVLFGVGTILLLWWVIRRARREGIFSATTANAFTWFGWFVIVGSMLSHVVEFTADLRLFAMLVPDGGWPRTDFPIAWWSVVTGLGLVSLGRVMAHAVVMREELDATV